MARPNPSFTRRHVRRCTPRAVVFTMRGHEGARAAIDARNGYETPSAGAITSGRELSRLWPADAATTRAALPTPVTGVGRTAPTPHAHPRAGPQTVRRKSEARPRRHRGSACRGCTGALPHDR